MRYEIISRPRAGIIFPKVISLDSEYSEVNIRKAKLLSISIGVSEDLTYILEDFKVVTSFMDNADVIYTWNGVVDAFVLTKSGFVFPKQKMVDAMLMEHLVDERLDHGLGDFAVREFNDNYKTEFWRKYDSYQAAPKEEAYDYEMRDGAYTYIAGRRYQDMLASRWPLVEHVHRLQWALFETETRGIRVNKNLMIHTKEEMGQRIAQYLPKLREEFSEHCKVWELQKWKQEIEKRKSESGRSKVPKPVFSFASDKNVSWLVYDGLELPVTEKTKKGSPSTSFETLKGLSEVHPEISNLVGYKETKAVYATFVEGMLERVQDGRIYPGFFINGTATGRISHNNPNLGNLPKEGVVRNFFIPDEGCVLVGADFAQLEVVIETNITEDPNLIRIVTEGMSKHDIFKVDLDKQGFNLERSQVKNVNFALQYDAQAMKIAKMVGCPVEDAQRIIDAFYTTFSGVKKKKDEVRALIDAGKPIVSLFGRERHFPVKFENKYAHFKAYRQAYNHIIQSTGADMTNRATYLIAERFKERGYGRLLWSVHDEILTEVKEKFVKEATESIIELMEESNDYLKLKYRVKAVPYGPLKAWAKT